MPTNVTRRVTLGLFGDITDLKSKLSWISTEKQKLERDGVTVPIDADAKKATLTVDDLRKKLADLSAKRASVLVNVDDKKAVASILNIDAKLASLDKKTSTPKISVTGAARALADIAAIDAAFDEMNRKAANAGGSRGGGFLGLFGGGGSSGGSGAASALSGLPFGLGNPAVLGGVAAASPFAGQALGGAAVFGLGSILAGLGIAGAFGLGGSSTSAQVAAAQQALRAAQLREQVAQAANAKKPTASTAASLASAQNAVVTAQGKLTTLQGNELTPGQAQVRQAFKNLSNSAQDDLSQIGKSFVPVMQSVLSTATGVLGKLTPVFSGAVKAISGPFETVTNIFLKSWEQPAIAQSINAVAGAFSAILKALAPSIPGMMRQIADAITAIANNVAKNPKAFADFIRFLVDIVTYALDAVNGLTVAANWIEIHFIPAIKAIGIAFLGMGIQILPAIQALVDGVLSAFGTILHGAADAFGWIPGIGGKIRAASKAFDDFKANTDANFNDMMTNMKRWQNDLIGSTAVSQSTAAKIVGHFSSQATAAKGAASQVYVYAQTIRQNGVISDAANGARQKLVNDMISAGVNASTANSDVAGYTEAVRKNGVSSDAATAARHRLIDDIESAFKNSQRGQSDMSNFTAAVMRNGSDSDAARAARARLIKDLENAGLSAGNAKGMVDRLQTSINALKGKTISVIMNGTGKFTVTEVGGVYGLSSTNSKTGQVNAYSVKAAASGLYVNSGKRGVDDQLILAQRGELVVPPGIVQSGAVDHLRGMIPGFANGGVVGVSGMYNTFQSQMTGAMERAMTSALKSVMSVGGVGGSGVTRWTPLVLQALSMLGLSSGLAGRVLYQISTESGGNQFAQNNWDINAQRGDPSRGLLQTIGATFTRFHVPGTSWNIFDALANIAAAINYADHTYGPTLMSGGMGMGSGHGYANGTPSARRGWAWVGEGGVPELVHFNGGEQVGPVVGGRGGGNTYYISVSPTPLAHPRDIGREVVGAIKAYESGSGKSWRS